MRLYKEHRPTSAVPRSNQQCCYCQGSSSRCSNGLGQGFYSGSYGCTRFIFCPREGHEVL